MIEVNLVPDVKQELIHAQRVRLSVISLATIGSIIAVVAVVVLGIFFGGESVYSGILDGQIKSESNKLADVADIDKTLTIQNQLTLINELHNSSHVDSRIFGILIPLSGQGTQSPVSYSNVAIDTTQKTVKIEAQTPQYLGLDTFKKTLAATKFKFTTAGSTNNQSTTEALASNVEITDQTLGLDSHAGIVVTFTLVFSYPDDLLAPSSQNVQIITPSAANATDSYQGIPTSLFTDKATTGGKN